MLKKFTKKELVKNKFLPKAGSNKKEKLEFVLPKQITKDEYSRIPEDIQKRYAFDTALYEAFEIYIYALKEIIIITFGENRKIIIEKTSKYYSVYLEDNKKEIKNIGDMNRDTLTQFINEMTEQFIETI